MTKTFKIIGILVVVYIVIAVVLGAAFHFTHGMCNEFVLAGTVSNESSLCKPVIYTIAMPFKFLISIIRSAGIML